MYCLDCGEEFRYDDCGGYNPPCVCGMHCRSCHDASAREDAEYDDDPINDHEANSLGDIA